MMRWAVSTSARAGLSGKYTANNRAGRLRRFMSGAKNNHQAQSNAGALTFSLTKEEVDALDQATRAWYS